MQTANDKEVLDHPDRQSVYDKTQVARASVTEALGSPNVYEGARRLWWLLYHPDEAAAILGEKAMGKYPDRSVIVSGAITLPPPAIPAEADFVAAVRHAMTNEVDFGACLSECSFRYQLGHSC